MADSNTVDKEKMDELFKEFKLQDEDGEPTFGVKEWKTISPERTEIYKRDVEGCPKDATAIFSCIAAPDDDGTESDFPHHIVAYNGEGLTELRTECKIMMEPNTPAMQVEYCFEDDVWRVSKIGGDACRHYRKSKFKVWEEMIKQPVCEASLRRMVQIGLITTLFDHLAFPNPPEMVEKYQALNEETNKMVQIPHPVKALRKWGTDKYEVFSARLDGCPKPEEEESYWKELMDYLRLNFPEEMDRIEKGEKKEI